MQARQPGTEDEHARDTMKNWTQYPGTNAFISPKQAAQNNCTATAPLQQAFEEMQGMDVLRGTQMMQSSPVPILQPCKSSSDPEIEKRVALAPCNPVDCALQTQTVEQGCSPACYLIAMPILACSAAAFLN
jgi:hypothetical protein